MRHKNTVNRALVAKNFTKLFALLVMAAMSMGVMASTVDDLVAIDHDYVFIADDVTNNGADGLTANTLYADGHIFTPTGNSARSDKGKSTFDSDGLQHQNSLRLKNIQNALAFKVSGACTVKFYTESHASRSIGLSKVARSADSDPFWQTQSASTNTWEVALDEAGVYYMYGKDGDFFIAGFEVTFDYPARENTFGLSAMINKETTPNTLNALASSSTNVNVSVSELATTYQTLSNRNVYHGSETNLTAPTVHRNLTTVTIKTQNGEEDGAENHNAYMAFTMNIAEGYKLDLREIFSDIYVADKGNWSYEIVIEDNENNELYKSPVQTIAKSKEGSDHSNTIGLLRWNNALQGLTGEVTVKLIWWIDSSSTYLAVKDFKVTGVLHEIESQTKILKAIEVNGESYDYATLGNTIDALYHAAPEVKFYYDVKNNWSDGAQTDAPDEDETIVASESAGNYVATTTLASTPYALTFTNIDLPKVFGITRAVATEKSSSTDTEGDGITPKTQNKYAVSADALVDPSVEGITMAMHYGTQDRLINQSRSYTWFNGTEAQDCFVDVNQDSYRTGSNELNADHYYSFDMTVGLGYQVKLMNLVSDVLVEYSKTGLKYLVKIYNNGEELVSMDEVALNATGADMKRSIDLSENAALQDLSGTITVKMFIYGNSGKYIIVKDLYVEAAVEEKAGEGVKGLSFESFEASAHPVFTEGEVTVTWSNSANNVAPASENRGIRVQSGYDYQMNVVVPDDSYISEVVFVWNSKSSRSAGDGVKYIDFMITDASDNNVGTLVVSGTKVDESTWSCGDLRESELTFTQGDGDFYLNSIRVTYLKKPATTTYVRPHTHMNLNTLCYPYQIDSYTGATFYTMLYKVVENTEVTEVVLEEHVGALEAGKPYFYVPEGTELVCNYSGDYTAAGNDGNGVYGSYTDMAAVTSGMYVTYNNQIIKAGDNVKLREYRAYINMDEVALQAVPAPGRRILRVGNADAPAVTTGVERIRTSEINGQKILRNGQLFIIRDGKTYDIFGRLVD